MKKKITVLPGDGIGQEIMNEAIKVLKAVEQNFNHQFEYNYELIGNDAIKKWGIPFPDITWDLCLNSDAILLGAISYPNISNPKSSISEQGLQEMYNLLGLYVNISPINFYNALKNVSPLKNGVVKNSNFVIIRNMASGVYSNSKEKRKNIDSAFDNRSRIERVAEVAFEYAQRRSNKLTVVDEANGLEASILWRDTISKMKNRYENVEVNFLNVDNAAMQIILVPSRFDVILTANMLGSILMDEAKAITGLLGMIPSESIGEKTSLFGPLHGFYPKVTPKNTANPLASVLSTALMLESSFNLKAEANAIREAVIVALEKGIVTKDLSPNENYYSTCEVGDFLSEFIANYKHKATFVSLEQDCLIPEVI